MSNLASGQSNPGYQNHAVRYTTPSRLDQLQGQVDEVTDVMRNNIRLELERGGKLDELESRSDALNEHSRQFQVGAKKVSNKYWWKSLKMSICLIIVILIIIAVIVVAIVLGTKKKS